MIPEELTPTEQAPTTPVIRPEPIQHFHEGIGTSKVKTRDLSGGFPSYTGDPAHTQGKIIFNKTTHKFRGGNETTYKDIAWYDDVPTEDDYALASSSATLRYSQDTETANVWADWDAWVEATHLHSPVGGRVKVKWDLKITSANGHTVYSKIYINGVAVGSSNEHSTTDYVTYTEDNVTVSIDDTIEIWVTGDLADNIGNNIKIQNFRLYYDYDTRGYIDTGDQQASKFSLGLGQTGHTYWNYCVPFVNVATTDAALWTESGTNVLMFNYATRSNGGNIYTIVTDSIGTAVTFAGTKKVIIEMALKCSAVGTADMQWGLGERFTDPYNDDSHAGAMFTVDDAGVLYAHTSNGHTGTAVDNTETAITGITLTNTNIYRIEWNPGASVLFYVNGILKQTLTTTLPDQGTIDVGVGSSGTTDYPSAVSMPSIAVEI